MNNFHTPIKFVRSGVPLTREFRSLATCYPFKNLNAKVEVKFLISMVKNLTGAV